MSKQMDSREEIMVGVKQIIANIVNQDREIGLSVTDIGDDEEIATSTVMQMDSIKAIKMVVEIERKFGITVPDEDLDMENFKHAAAITSYVEMRSVACGGA